MRYIAFEGIDGAGKSTQIALFNSWLTRRYYTPITLFEPTYGPHGSAVRQAIEANQPISLEDQIRRFTLDRKQHVDNKIRPLLQFVRSTASFVIVQDRCYLSAPAYQALGKAAMLSLLKEQRTIAPAPELIFLLDAPVGQALERKARKGMRKGLFDQSPVLTRVRENYLFLAVESGERVRIIDGAQAIEDVHDTIIASVADQFQQFDAHKG